MIAFSRTRNVYGTANGTTLDSLRAGIDAIVRAAGWTRSAVTGGYKYVFSSRQDLSAACYIRDLGDTQTGTPLLRINFGSADGARMGRNHFLAVTDARTHYDVIANGVHVFIALRGVANVPPSEGLTFGVLAASVCGGIPYVPIDPTPCGNEPVVTEAWWSSGAAGGFRFNWLHDENNDWSACYNEDLYHAGSGREARLRVLPTGTPNADFGLFPSNPQVQWMDGSPLYFDPLLAWGYPTARVRGQIYDCMLASKDVALDSPLYTYEQNPETGGAYPEAFTWRSWSHYIGDMSYGAPGTYYGSLYVLTDTPGAYLEGNYAY